MLALTRHHLHIQALVPEGDYLLIQDVSRYRDWPEYPRLALLKPGTRTPLQLEFSPSQTNVYHCEQLGGSIPDGVYTATYSAVPHDQLFVCYDFLRTYRVDCRIQAWIRSVDWQQEPTDSPAYHTLARLTALRQAAYAEVSAGRTRQAQTYYRELSDFVPR